MTEFEWDESKRLANLEKHRFDFDDAVDFFDGRPTTSMLIEREGEIRILTTSFVLDRMRTIIWTPRNGRIRVISVRRAHAAEIRTYRALHGG